MYNYEINTGNIQTISKTITSLLHNRWLHLLVSASCTWTHSSYTGTKPVEKENSKVIKISVNWDASCFTDSCQVASTSSSLSTKCTSDIIRPYLTFWPLTPCSTTWHLFYKQICRQYICSKWARLILDKSLDSSPLPSPNISGGSISLT